MSTHLNIRARMLLTAVLPVTLIAFLLAALFLGARVDDLGASHDQRVRSLIRQVATASEYGLFSANASHLQSIANGAMRQPDVRSVQIVNLQGQPLAQAGLRRFASTPNLGYQELARRDEVLRADLLVQPITAIPVRLDDLFDVRSPGAEVSAQLLGHVMIEFSREALYQREKRILMLGLLVALGGLCVGVALAIGLSRGVSRPIFRIFDVIERIGHGELSARATVLPDDPLHDLQMGLNQMAQRLESGRDDLEQRIAEATTALREKKEEAETATLAKSRFLAAASHDLRQPTHALGMFVARLTQLPHDDETRHLISNLDASVHALQDLLDALLDISRLDAGAVQVQLRPVELAEVFRQLETALVLSAEDKGLRLRFRPTTARVMTDPTLIYRVMLNLVSNAVRYTRSGSVLVACRVGQDGQSVRIEVRDSGVGIAPEHQTAIFKEFYQVGNSERDRSKGLGLGLNIVDRTVRLLGHVLSLRSAPGCGTCFSLRLPLVSPEAAMQAPPVPSVLGSGDLAGLIVLVIEDDALARSGLVALLLSWGAQVRAYERMESALADLDEEAPPDVIVSDYRLPDGSNGIEAVRRLRLKAGFMVPACLMSGDTDVGLIQKAKSEGLTLLHKPVRPAKLRSLLRRLTVSSRVPA